MGFRGNHGTGKGNGGPGRDTDALPNYCGDTTIGYNICSFMRKAFMSKDLTPYSNEDYNTLLWKDFLITDLEITSDKKEMIKHFNENVLGFSFSTAGPNKYHCIDNAIGYLGCEVSSKKMDEFKNNSKNPDEFNKIRNEPLFHKRLQKIDDKYSADLIPILKKNNIMEKMRLQSPVFTIDASGVKITPLAVEDSKIIQDWYTSKPDDTKIDTILKNGTVEVNGKNYKFTTRIYPVHYKITNMINMIVKWNGLEYLPDPNDRDTINKNYKYTFYVKIFVEEIKPGTSDQNVPQEGTYVEEENNNVVQEDSNVQQGDPKNGGRKSRRKSSKKSRKSRRKSRKYKRNY